MLVRHPRVRAQPRCSSLDLRYFRRIHSERDIDKCHRLVQLGPETQNKIIQQIRGTIFGGSLLLKQTLISSESSYVSSPASIILILILDDSFTTVVPLNHVTSGFGFALHLHFIVIKVPVSFGMILGFSTNDGAKPASSPPGTVHVVFQLGG